MWQNFLNWWWWYISSDITCKWTVTFTTWSMVSSNPSSLFAITKPKVFFHQKRQLSKLKYCKHLKQLTPIFYLLQLMTMENYSEKCSQIQVLLKDIIKGRSKLNIQFRLASYFMQYLRNDFLGTAFSFSFDETMTWSEKTIWCLYTMLVEFHEMYCDIILWITFCWPFSFWNFGRVFFWVYKKPNFDINYLLHIGMDTPDVNLKFQKLLMNADVLTNINKLFLDIATCPLHVVHNSFHKGVTALNFHVDQYALDIHFFFKLSAEWGADYKSIGDVTNIVSEYAMKHSTARWVTLRKNVVWLIEQYENLKEYFLIFFPKTAHFQDVKKSKIWTN